MRCDIYITASEAREALEAQGLEGHALEACVKAGGKDRHARRTTAARLAAKNAANEYHFIGFWEERCVSAALLYAEMVGVGGGLFGNGYATRRQTAFAGLGKGRRQATDGGAWDVAVKDAFIYVMEGNTILEFYAEEDGDDAVLSARLVRDVVKPLPEDGKAEVVTEMMTDCGLWPGVLDTEWAESLALVALGVRQAQAHRKVRFADTPALWGKLYNHFRALARQVEEQSQEAADSH